MYIITADGRALHNPGSLNTAVTDPILDMSIGDSGNFTCSVPVNNPQYDKIKKLKTVIKVFWDKEELWEGRVLDDAVDFYNTKTLTVEGPLAYFNDSTQRPYDEDWTDRELLQFLINEHNEQVDDFKRFELGNVTVEMETEETDRVSTEYKKTKQALDDLISKYEGYLVVRKEGGIRYLDYLKGFQNVSPQPIHFGKNLIDIKKDNKGADIATVIIPLGATVGSERVTIEDVNGGLDYLRATSETIEEYGEIWAPVIFEDVDDAEELLIEAENYLTETTKPKITIEATALDLSIIDVDIKSFSVGDKAKVISPPHKIDDYFQANSIRLNLSNPEKSELVLGAEIPTASGRSVSIANKIKEIESKLVDMYVAGSTTIRGGVELFHATPYIDFHFGNSTADYTTKLIESSSGSLQLIGSLTVTGQLRSGGSVAPSVTNSYGCGLDANRWSTVYTNAINATGTSTLEGNINSLTTYNRTLSGTPNMYVSTAGYIGRGTSSSERYKRDICPVENAELSPKALYKLNVVQYRYKDGYISGNEYDYPTLIGLIAEDVAKKYPIAVDCTADGEPEMWKWDIMVPAILKLVQDQKKQIDKQAEQIESLQQEMAEMKKLVMDL